MAKLKGTYVERPKRREPPNKKAKKRAAAAPAPAPAPVARAMAPQPTPVAPVAPVAPVVQQPVVVPEQPPNQILFLTSLPEETNEMMLQMLFNQ